MQTHSYSTVLYNLSWQDIADAEQALNKLDGEDATSIRASYDSSGGERDDGTTYSTEATLNVEYRYELGDGDVAANALASLLVELPFEGEMTQADYHSEIVGRA